MKIVEINTVHFGSTGKIMLGIANSAQKNKFGIYTVSKKWRDNSYICSKHLYTGSLFSNITHRICSPITGNEIGYSCNSTRNLIAKLQQIDPDIIHLHNLHGWYINIPMLFDYIKKNNIKVVWTLHDCWAFTGHCPHFTMVGCDKWKTGCHNCPSYRDYPASLFDNSKRMYNLKKTLFTAIPNMTIVTPSEWLAKLVKQSFLHNYPVKVINNGIDLSVFKPTDSDFRKKHGLEGKFVLLGVAFGWGERKGLDVFIDLSKRLDDRFRIVLVGTDEKVDKLLPDNIISIHRTQNQSELAEIYSTADLFVNPTREEVLGLVNIESLACGTPVVTFRTGGSPEVIDATCGSVVECDDIDTLESEIVDICTNIRYTADACLTRAMAFDMNERYKEYLELYKNI